MGWLGLAYSKEGAAWESKLADHRERCIAERGQRAMESEPACDRRAAPIEVAIRVRLRVAVERACEARRIAGIVEQTIFSLLDKVLRASAARRDDEEPVRERLE